MAFERAGIQWLEQLKAAQELRRNGHDGSPVVKFPAILDLVSDSYKEKASANIHSEQRTPLPEYDR